MLRPLRARLRGAASRLRADSRAVAAMEFALVAPILVLMLGAVPDIGNAMMAAGRTTKLAESMAELFSQSKVTLTEADIQQILAAAPLIDPSILTYARTSATAVASAADVAVTSVAFKPTNAACKQNCQYEANVVFSRSISGKTRPCGKLNPSDDGAATSLPPKTYSANALVVIDVETHFRPLLSTLMGGDMTFRRSAYFRPRYVDALTSVKNCPAYAS